MAFLSVRGFSPFVFLFCLCYSRFSLVHLEICYG